MFFRQQNGVPNGHALCCAGMDGLRVGLAWLMGTAQLGHMSCHVMPPWALLFPLKKKKFHRCTHQCTDDQSMLVFLSGHHAKAVHWSTLDAPMVDR